MKRIGVAFAIVITLGLAFAASTLALPYYAVGPGPAREVVPLIQVEGHPTYGSAGKLILTTVQFTPLTPLRAVLAWLDPTKAVISSDRIFPAGESVKREEQRALSQMDQSKIDATYVVLHELVRYPREHGAGALIESIVPGCPAEGELFAGDVISSIDGRVVSSAREASRVIDSAAPTEAITFDVAAAGQKHTVEMTRRPCGADGKRLVGVTLVDAFPFRVVISSGDVGGPSAGLMWSLGLYDLLTPGDLTRGRVIAGTGTIDPQGKVGAIGGIRDKVIAAERAGAGIFLVPDGNMRELRGMDTGDMRLVPVATFSDAIASLPAR